MSCSQWRDLLLDAACGELPVESRQDLDSHLATCPACVAELADLKATLGTVAAAMPARPAPGELDAWPRVAAVLDRPRRGSRLTLGYPLAAVAACALLALGIGLGRWLQPTPSPHDGIVAGSPDSPAAEVSEYSRFLERATPLLLAVANRGNGATANLVSFDAGTEQALAAALAAEARELGETLAVEGRSREAKLVENLEIVFLQMANAPQDDYTGSLDLVQTTIEQRAILFQLTVEEMRRRPPREIPLG